MSNTYELLLGGFATALQPMNLLWAFTGTFLGTAVGVLPGIGPGLTLALLLPITYSVEPSAAFILFAGIYYGAMYGGSTTSILLNTPGESATMVTALEGYQMARSGRAAAALSTAAIGSFVAGTIGTLALTILSPIVAEAALQFGPPEFCGLLLLSFAAVSSLMGSSVLRGTTALLFGLWLGLIGIDNQTGQPRLTFGFLNLSDGIDMVLVAVGLFAIGEAVYQLARWGVEAGMVEKVDGQLWMTKEDWKRSWKPWLRGTAIGFPIGAIPAGGAEIPTFLSYFTEKKLSRHPEEFGKGAIEGVAGPEAANNASTAGVLVPLLTLGIPTSVAAAIMLSAFQSYGITPGPLLFESQPDLVWSVIASLYIANGMLLVLNLPLVGLWIKLLKVPPPLLYAGILIMATVGTYGITRSVEDLVLLYAIGALGLAMRIFDFPVAPVIIGLILGPIAEQEFRRSMALSHGDPSIFFHGWISSTFICLALVIIAAPAVTRVFALLRKRSGGNCQVTDA
ncbi:tripartite tricarboxylate transporter permease [Rhizobium puerariae]|uniref:Tripartite tricarboxylate transporter permease n=1 Tax=Rhizobium puerariae TaxID=1585791 RepID=A0ABV6ARN0_9HYPH